MRINYHLKKNIVELIHANYKYFFCLANWIFIYHSIISSSENLVLNDDYWTSKHQSGIFVIKKKKL